MRFLKRKDSEFDDSIAKLLAEMNEYGPGTPEWEKSMNDLKGLTAMRAMRASSIDPNTVLIVLGNLFGIGIIVAYEQKHIFGSAARNLLLRTR